MSLLSKFSSNILLQLSFISLFSSFVKSNSFIILNSFISSKFLFSVIVLLFLFDFDFVDISSISFLNLLLSFLIVKLLSSILINFAFETFILFVKELL